jgi:hypothetical protein
MEPGCWISNYKCCGRARHYFTLRRPVCCYYSTAAHYFTLRRPVCCHYSTAAHYFTLRRPVCCHYSTATHYFTLRKPVYNKCSRIAHYFTLRRPLYKVEAVHYFTRYRPLHRRWSIQAHYFSLCRPVHSVWRKAGHYLHTLKACLEEAYKFNLGWPVYSILTFVYIHLCLYCTTMLRAVLHNTYKDESTILVSTNISSHTVRVTGDRNNLKLNYPIWKYWEVRDYFITRQAAKIWINVLYKDFSLNLRMP